MAALTDAEALALEKKWLAELYQPNSPQLTARAVITGMLLGAVMCLANLYIVLKTGWSVGVTLTACIMAWAIFSLVGRALGPKHHMGILENNAMGSVASAAGYMTGGGNMAALPALIMLTGQRPEPAVMMAWFACIAGLGVFAAIPIKRQLINREQLTFPSGTATAETLKALYAHGEEGKKQARYLGIAGLFAAVLGFLREAKLRGKDSFTLPSEVSLPISFHGSPLLKWTIGMELSVLMVGAGGLMSFRTGWSLLLGAFITYGFVAPPLVEQGIVTEVGFKAIAAWSVWMGAAVLVSSGLTTFAFQWRSVVKSLSSLTTLFQKQKPVEDDPMVAIEAPQSWFPLGFLVLGPPTVLLAWWAFDIPWWAGALALPLSVIMGIVAARVTGETDVTPTKALGPVTQLTFAGLLPGQLTPNIMSANITGGVGLHAADLLTDLKSGYLLGARPRQQVIGQFFGVIAGSLVIVPVFNLLVPTADVLGSKDFPAPSAQVWANVSKMLVQGLDALHPTARWAALIGVVVGVTLAVLEVKLPKSAKKYLPSPSGLGIAMVLPAWNSIMMFVGAAGAELIRRRKGDEAGERIVMPTASGFVAGESLMGVAIKMLIAFGVLSK